MLNLSERKGKAKIIGEQSAPQLCMWHRPRAPKKTSPGPEKPSLTSFPQE